MGIWDFESERGNSISNRVYLGKKVGGKLEISRPNEILDLDILSLREIQALFERGDVRAGKKYGMFSSLSILLPYSTETLQKFFLEDLSVISNPFMVWSNIGL